MVEETSPVTTRHAVTITQSRTSWGLEIGQHRLALTRMREARVVGQLKDPPARNVAKSAWPLAIGTFASVSAFGLFVFGAVASEPLPLPQFGRYSVSVPVPARSAASEVDAPIRRARKIRVAVPPVAVPTSQEVAFSGSRFELADEPYVTKAMRTGEFQEWLGADGQRRFLSVGAEQADGERRCRELALLVRRTDGSNQARSARRCAAGAAHQNANAASDRLAEHVMAASDSAEAAPNDLADEKTK